MEVNKITLLQALESVKTMDGELPSRLYGVVLYHTVLVGVEVDSIY